VLWAFEGNKRSGNPHCPTIGVGLQIQSPRVHKHVSNSEHPPVPRNISDSTRLIRLALSKSPLGAPEGKVDAEVLSELIEGILN